MQRHVAHTVECEEYEQWVPFHALDRICRTLAHKCMSARTTRGQLLKFQAWHLEWIPYNVAQYFKPLSSAVEQYHPDPDFKAAGTSHR